METTSSGIKFDRAAAILGLVVAVALLPVQLVLTHIYAQTLPPVLALACLIYLAATGEETEEDSLRLPTSMAHLLPSVVVFGAAGLFLLANVQGGRTDTFYVAAALIGTLLLGQILFARDRDLHTGVLLTQIVALGATIRYAAVLNTPGYIGIDVWTHMTDFTRGMMEANSIAGMGSTKYVMAPLYHLLVGATSLFSGLPLRESLFVSLGLVMPVGAVLVFGGARYLVEDRWALFAAGLFALSGSAIRWGIHLIPTSMGLLLFLAVLAIVIRLFRAPTSPRDGLLLITLFMAMALTHQVSSFILLVFLIAAMVVQYALKTGIMDPPRSSAHGLGVDDVEPISFGGYFVFNAGFLTLTWSLTPYYGRSFIATVFIFLQDSFGGGSLIGGSSGGGGGGGGGASQSQPLVEFVVVNFDVLGFLLLLFGTTVGCLYALRRSRTNQATLTLVAAAVAMTAFTLLPPLIGIGTFLSGRWFAFLFAVMAVLTAVGFGHLRRGLAPTLMVVFLVVFLYAYPIAMVASPKATVDAPMLEHERPQFSYTEEELAAMRTVGSVTTGSDEDPIYTDFPYNSAFNRYHSERFGTATVPPDARVNESEVIYRRYQTDAAPYFSDGDGMNRIHRVRKSAMCPTDRNVVYTNGDVTFCRAP
ncbi:hypothetical protein [Haloglomus salinum]|jgi:hypothetical protein|uniref:hypothetical protein n=1 Tax=Haloglomus salinum TaxID=2962673 RepID=UPI0020C9D91B|nr:hypothetical protein [Haloglomus salinum]